jgi:hypothetical protein
MNAARKCELRSLKPSINSIYSLKQFEVNSLINFSYFLPIMTIQNVLLLGATGETGGSILTGLLDAGHFVRGFCSFTSPAHNQIGCQSVDSAFLSAKA